MTTVERETPVPDPNAVEEFGDRVMGILNDACTAMMLSIGHQTGLLDTLAGRAPATSDEVAAASALDERYVREWLNALTTARVLEYDPRSQRYRLPDEHAAWLTEAAGPQNMARTMTFVPLLAEVEQGIVRCFRTGGGLSYADYPRFHELMAEDSRAIHDAGLIEGILPLVEGLTDRLRSGIDVADIGCGSGHAVNLIARGFPNSRVRGFDFSVEAVEAGRAEARAWGLTNAEFSVLDVATLAEVAAYDLVTAFDAIHDQAHPGRVLVNVARALRPDGVFLMVDIKASSNVEDNLELPWAPFLYTVSTMHCMTVSLGLDGEGLGTAWGWQLATSMLHDVGFGTVDVLDVETDPFNSYYVCRR